MTTQAGPPRASAPKIPPQLEARYEIQRLIGRGGMGHVFQAMDRQLGRTVAIKLVDPSLISREGLARFRREMLQMAKFSHPNIVRLYDAGIGGQQPYIVMEYLDGENVDAKLRDGPVEPALARRIVAGVLEGLALVHDQGQLHRDLKPSNILIRGQDHPVLIDFGLVKPQDESTLLTEDGAMVGTPYYMAPELLSGGAPSVASDLFGVGLVGFALLTGTDVHGDTAGKPIDLVQFSRNLALGKYHQAAERALAGHGSLGAALLRSLDPDPTRRFSSARDMLKQMGGAEPLTRAGRSSSGSSGPRPAINRPSVARYGAVAAVVLVAAMAIGIPRGERAVTAPSPVRSPSPKPAATPTPSHVLLTTWSEAAEAFENAHRRVSDDYKVARADKLAAARTDAQINTAIEERYRTDFRVGLLAWLQQFEPARLRAIQGTMREAIAAFIRCESLIDTPRPTMANLHHLHTFGTRMMTHMWALGEAADRKGIEAYIAHLVRDFPQLWLSHALDATRLRLRSDTRWLTAAKRAQQLYHEVFRPDEVNPPAGGWPDSPELRSWFTLQIDVLRAQTAANQPAEAARTLARSTVALNRMRPEDRNARLYLTFARSLVRNSANLRRGEE